MPEAQAPAGTVQIPCQRAEPDTSDRPAVPHSASIGQPAVPRSTTISAHVKDKEAAQADRDVQAEVQKVSDALGDTGRILVRPSGTEPLIRVMVEAPTDEICGKYVAQVVEMIEKKGLAE